jgi:23S rRNA pseudouridine2605 synthase
MHPRGGLVREYAVRVMGEADAMQVHRLTHGIELEDGPAKFETLEDAGGEGANRWYKVTLKEGRNREVRRLFESQGLTVSRLMRTQYGPIVLDRALGRGKSRDLEGEELAALYAAAGLPPPAAPARRETKPAPRATHGKGRKHAAPARGPTVHEADKPARKTLGLKRKSPTRKH